MQPNSLNILPWYTALKYQNHRLKPYAYGQIFRLQVERNQLPPFQLVRSGLTGAAIFTFTLTEIKTGVVTDVTAAILSAGLTVTSYPTKGYDIIKYPSKTILPTSLLPYGLYYGTMTDTNGSTWYSEIFAMVQSLDGMVRIEYSHGDDFCYSGGHIDYSGQYQNAVNIKTDLGKPVYEYLEEVEERAGYNFPIQQISYKLFRFEFPAPEYLIDALRVVRMHDFIRVKYKGITYEVDDFLLEPEWLELGDIANVVCEFKTDTVVVVNGRGVTSASPDPDPGECTGAEYLPVAFFIENSAEYLGAYYLDATTFEQVDLEIGDLVLIEDEITAAIQLYEWDGGAYNLQVPGEGETAQDQNTGQYYWKASVINQFATLILSSILNTGKTGLKYDPKIWTVFSNSLGSYDVVVEIYTVDQDGNEALAGVGTPIDLGLGLEFEWNEGAIGIKGKVSNATCEDFVESDIKYFEGVNYWTLESDFEVQ